MRNGPQLAVSVAIFKGEEILLVKRSRPPAKGLYALPGGRVRFGEALQDAARREVLEETGLRVESLRFHRLVEIIGDGTDGIHHYVLAVFSGSVSDGEARAGDDAAEAGFFPPDRLDGLALTQGTVEVVGELRAITGT